MNPDPSPPKPPLPKRPATVVESVEELRAAGHKLRSRVIGGASECDLVVDRPTVSDRHCCLFDTARGYFLHDLRSKNGTFVNGVKINSPTRVVPADTITLGRTERMPWPSDWGTDGAVIHLGRDRENDVVFESSVVSAFHARLRRSGDDWVVEDLGSANGTCINSTSVKITCAKLSAGDTVFLGSHRVPAARLLAEQAEQAVAGRALNFEGHEMVLGRDPTCDQVLDYPMISGRHARLVRSGKQILVEDLGSANGTFVNGRRIQQAVAARPGDVVGLGSFSFTLTAEGRFEMRDSRGNLTIEAKGIAVDVPGHRLLDDVALTILPSEFVGLMGPSGAGKSTLMNVLNGYTRPSCGTVLLNGQDLYAHYARFQGQIGYVPQEDILHRDLTVGQALFYTARLRLPTDFSDADIRGRVGAVLEQLGIADAEHVLIGSPEKKGTSGGQRKRVNLAMELLTDPSALFLDEPTSGLSSEDALLVMRLLRQLADGGKTILLTIHQPSLAAFRLLDNLAVVAKDVGGPGQLVYYGPAYPDAITFFNPDGRADPRPGSEPAPDEVLRGLSKAPAAQWVEAYARSDVRRAYVADRAGTGPADQPGGVVPDSRRGQALAQFGTLVRRLLAIKVKDSWNTAILLAQAPIIAVLIVLVFGRDAAAPDWATAATAVASTMWDLVLAGLWFGCSNAAREIVAERAIYQRERMVNLRIGAYVGSKFAVLGALCFVQCVVLLGIVHAGNGLKGPWLAEFGVLLLASVVGLALGLVVSALARTSEAAIALVPLLLFPMLILGGALPPIHKMNAVMRVASRAMPSRWAHEGILTLEAAAQPKISSPISMDAEDMAEHAFPRASGRTGVIPAILILVAMLALLAGSIHLVLRRRDVH